MDIQAYSAHALLRDGVPVLIRAIRPTDRTGLQWGFARLSADAVYHRFFQAKRSLSEEELRYLTEVDFRDHVALVAVAEFEGADRVVGVGRFVRLAAPDKATPSGRAEVAFTVGEEFQGRGVATLLLDHLARIARRLDITHFEAVVLPENRPMLEVFEHSGLAISEEARDGVVHVAMALDGPRVPGEPPVADVRPRRSGG
ncbi:MAG TPA: GNAT family N-acetyltransferase [Gemmatimonadales bacterium]|nr:GNAT family N-acetyltransferase [Gemmatimonadales bacterium]